MRRVGGWALVALGKESNGDALENSKDIDKAIQSLFSSGAIPLCDV